MSDARSSQQTENTAAAAGDTAEHATNPLVASYDIIDFLTTIAFVTANTANSLSPLLPLASNLLHILNYGLLCYIQAKGLHTLGRQQALDEIHAIDGTISNDDALAIARKELLPPERGRKSEAEFLWDIALYILKMMICIFLTTISILSIAVMTGAVAAIINGAMLPIAYVITCGINVLKFGKNTLKGIYDYFFKGWNTEQGTACQRNHDIVDRIEVKLESNKFEDAVTEAEVSEYVSARNAISKAGQDNIQNGIFLGLSSAFLAASILLVLSSSLLVSAVIPPVGATIASALFVGAGIIFAIHGISVLANVIRKSRGQPEKQTFFGWITEKLYPTITKEDVCKKYPGKIAPTTAALATTTETVSVRTEPQAAPAKKPEGEKKKVTAFSLSPTWGNFSGSLHGGVNRRAVNDAAPQNSFSMTAPSHKL